MSEPFKNIGQVARVCFDYLSRFYLFPLYHYLKANEELIPQFPAFLLHPTRIIMYFGKTHLAIEYSGPESKDILEPETLMPLSYFDYTQSDSNFFESIVGFSFKEGSNSGFAMPLPQFMEDMIIPTDSGFDKLIELKWNFATQDSIMGLNVAGITIEEKQFNRWVNSLFFHADKNGLKTRHIKWIDFIPLVFDDSGAETDQLVIDFSFMKNLVPIDAKYQYPSPKLIDFKYAKLPQLNRFIELVGTSETTELAITSFLSESQNRFILTMGILSKEIYSQLKGVWQSESTDPIIPDFFALRPNGYADIVEFKLPYLKGNAIVGRSNRETFSAEINSYISQTRVYKTYFEDPANRHWFKSNYGFEVLYPKRILVIGRRWDFSTKEWKEIINDYRDVEILTYDDLIDGVTAQFYM